MSTTPNYRGRFLQGKSTGENIGKEKEAGLPNITGSMYRNTKYGPSWIHNPTVSGAFTLSSWAYGSRPFSSHVSSAEKGYGDSRPMYFDASYSNSIYGKSSTVQPPAVIVKYIIKAE